MTAYSDLFGVVGTDPLGTTLIEPHNIIFSAASETVVTTDRNCIQVTDPAIADLFFELETFATDKKRPVLTNIMDQTVAMISSSSIAKNAGVATLEGYNIPTVDQLGANRPSTPSIGAVEYKIGTSTPSIINTDPIKLNIKGRDIFVSGITKPTNIKVYSLVGSLLKNTIVSDNDFISLQGVSGNIFIFKIENQNFKVLVR